MRQVLILAVVGAIAIAPGVEAKQKKQLTTMEVQSNICSYRRSGMSVEKLHDRARSQLNQGINLDKALIGLSDVEKIRYKYDHNMAIIEAANQLVEITIVDPKCQANR